MLRKIKPDDAMYIRDINEFSLEYNASTEFTKAKITQLSCDAHHFILVFEDEHLGRVVGYIHAEIYENLFAESRFNILVLAVSPDFQNKGIGKQLISALETEGRARGYSSVRLNSGEHRLEAHKFYEACGYTCNKLQKRFSKNL